MLNFKLQIFLFLLLTGNLFYLIRLVKQEYLDLKDTILWFFGIFSLILATIFPVPFFYLSTLLGFEKTINMFFLISIFILFFIILRQTISISRALRNNRILLQELVLLKKEYMDDKSKMIN